LEISAKAQIGIEFFSDLLNDIKNEIDRLEKKLYLANTNDMDGTQLDEWQRNIEEKSFLYDYHYYIRQEIDNLIRYGEVGYLKRSK